jgi:ribosome biogenesis GTPase
MEGIVTKSTGSWYQVRTPNGGNVNCRIKGKFRLDNVKHTNPVTVGDHIEFDMEPEQETGIIQKIHPRKNYIIRKASNLSKQTHIIASNMDQAVMVATLAFPTTSLGFIDRFLVTAEAYHIPAVIVFNKADLYGEALQEIVDDTIQLYEKVGYRCLQTSVVSGQGLDELKTLLTNKTTLLSGHSGVGKSSLLNTIEPNLHIKTAVISSHHLKGQHTTTFAEMHALSFGGFIIDTPGIREFGIVDIEDALLSHYFREMRAYIGQCRFNNCKHLNEPGCAVMKAVAEGSISEERYHSYLSILANEDLYA